MRGCGKKFCWETLALKAHIEKRHELGLEEYRQRYMQDYEEAGAAGEGGRGGGANTGDLDTRINQCQYQCYLCGQTFSLDRYFAEHLKQRHSVTKHDYKASFGPSLARKVVANCQLCRGNPREFLVDQAYLGVHIRTAHKETVAGYLQLLEGLEEAVEECRQGEEWCYQCRFVCCGLVFSQKWRFDRHVSSQHGISASEFSEQMRASPGQFLRKQVNLSQIHRTQHRITRGKSQC